MNKLLAVPGWAWIVIAAVAVVVIVVIIAAIVISKKKNGGEREPVEESGEPKKSASSPKPEGANEEKKVNRGRVYHITERKEDGKWQIKGEGDQKAIKLFDTQAEAIDYGKTLAENQDGRIVIHKKDGSIRKMNY